MITHTRAAQLDSFRLHYNARRRRSSSQHQHSTEPELLTSSPGVWLSSPSPTTPPKWKTVTTNAILKVADSKGPPVAFVVDFIELSRLKDLLEHLSPNYRAFNLRDNRVYIMIQIKILLALLGARREVEGTTPEGPRFAVEVGEGTVLEAGVPLALGAGGGVVTPQEDASTGTRSIMAGALSLAPDIKVETLLATEKDTPVEVEGMIPLIADIAGRTVLVLFIDYFNDAIKPLCVHTRDTGKYQDIFYRNRAFICVVDLDQDVGGHYQFFTLSVIRLQFEGGCPFKRFSCIHPCFQPVVHYRLARPVLDKHNIPSSADDGYSPRDHSHHRSPDIPRKRLRTEQGYVQASSGRRSHEGGYSGASDYTNRYSYSEVKGGYGEERGRGGYRDERRSSATAGFRDRSRDDYSHRKSEDSGMPPPSSAPMRHLSTRGSYRGRISTRGRGMSRIMTRRTEPFFLRKRGGFDSSYALRKKVLTSRTQMENLRRLRLLKLRRHMWVGVGEMLARLSWSRWNIGKSRGFIWVGNPVDPSSLFIRRDYFLFREPWFSPNQWISEPISHQEGDNNEEDEELEEGETKDKKEKPKVVKKKKVIKKKPVEKEEPEEGEEVEEEEGEADAEGGTTGDAEAIEVDAEEEDEDDEEDGDTNEDGDADVSKSSKKSTKSEGGVHVTIKQDSDGRDVSEEGRPKHEYIRLSCPLCFFRCFTFHQYHMHLRGVQHMGAMRRQNMKLKQTLATMRMKQRRKQHIVESTEEDLSPQSNFCYVCKLNYRQLKTAHTLSDSHRVVNFQAMKRFLMPSCTTCNLRFKSPMQYEYHICSLYHIKLLNAFTIYIFWHYFLKAIWLPTFNFLACKMWGITFPKLLIQFVTYLAHNLKGK
uniref:C2H2-type domain-containing protein n=1 Tax=Timema poppense TaxID=170557 RepID=A0A7R9CZZ7_TIMPO|nr:unnamed protein product [Timema poppensis]